LTDLLKGMMKNRKSDSFYFTKEVRAAFKKLKKYFKLTFILRLYDSNLLIRFKTNIFKFAIKIIIFQLFLTENDKRKNNIRLRFDREN
jgi:hypothetical protein